MSDYYKEKCILTQNTADVNIFDVGTAASNGNALAQSERAERRKNIKWQLSEAQTAVELFTQRRPTQSEASKQIQEDKQKYLANIYLADIIPLEQSECIDAFVLYVQAEIGLPPTKYNTRNLYVVLVNALYSHVGRFAPLRIGFSAEPAKLEGPEEYRIPGTNRGLVPIIKQLSEHGLVEYHSGVPDFTPGFTGRLSVYWPSTELIRLFAQFQLENIDLLMRRPPVLLRSRKAKTLNEHYRYTTVKGDSIPFINIPKRRIDITIGSKRMQYTIDIPSMQRDVESYNRLLHGVKYGIDENAPSEAIVLINEALSDGSKIDNQYTRIFNNGVFSEGGRYYNHFIQTLKKNFRSNATSVKARSFVTMDGNPCVELDYSSIHLTMLYGFYKQPLGHDPYTIPSWPKRLQKQYRSLFKTSTLVLLNASSRRGGMEAIWQKYVEMSKDDPQAPQLTQAELRNAVDEFVKHHSPIADAFFSGIGIQLQAVDSRVATIVINKMTSRGIPVLCLHDSFITYAQHRDYLYELMKEAFREVCVFDCGVK